MQLTWKDLFDCGTIVHLTVGIWSGMVKVSPNDLGIPDTQEVRDVLTLGHERLVPKESLDRMRTISGEARKGVDNSSISFPLIIGGRFVPKNKRTVLEETLSYHRTLFEAAKLEFVANYNNYKETMKPKIRKALMDATSDSELVERALERISTKYPSSNKIVNKFKFEWKSFTISEPIDDAVASSVNSIETDVKDAINTMMKTLREEILEKVEHIKKMLTSGAKFTAKTLRASRDLFKKVRELNVFEDAKLMDTIAKFEKILIGIEPDKDTSDTMISLNELEEELKDSLENAVALASEKLAVGKRQFK